MTTGRDPNLTRVFALCLLGAILLARPALGADEGAAPAQETRPTGFFSPPRLAG
jgi:hypothetical protein